MVDKVRIEELLGLIEDTRSKKARSNYIAVLLEMTKALEGLNRELLRPILKGEEE